MDHDRILQQVLVKLIMDLWDPLTGREFLDQLSNHHLIKDFGPWPTVCDSFDSVLIFFLYSVPLTLHLATVKSHS
jgi:hypothetical protein